MATPPECNGAIKQRCFWSFFRCVSRKMRWQTTMHFPCPTTMDFTAQNRKKTFSFRIYRLRICYTRCSDTPVLWPWPYSLQFARRLQTHHEINANGCGKFANSSEIRKVNLNSICWKLKRIPKFECSARTVLERRPPTASSS